MREFIFSIPLLASFSALQALAARTKRSFHRPASSQAGNYSQGILVDDTLYISGQGGEDAAGKIAKRL